MENTNFARCVKVLSLAKKKVIYVKNAIIT